MTGVDLYHGRADRRARYPHHPGEPLPRQRFRQRSNDGDTSAHGRFEEQRHARLLGCRDELRAAGSNALFVRSNDRLAGPEGLQHEVPGRILTAHDLDDEVNPGADEYCNGEDDDCDGLVDEDESLDALTWYEDADGDGYGDAASIQMACAQPAGYVASAGDCDDTSPDCTFDCTDADGDGVRGCDFDVSSVEVSPSSIPSRRTSSGLSRQWRA